MMMNNIPDDGDDDYGNSDDGGDDYRDSGGGNDLSDGDDVWIIMVTETM